MTTDYAFDFECCGVAIRINAKSPDLIANVEERIRSLIPGMIRKERCESVAAVFDVWDDDSGRIAATDHHDIGIVLLPPDDFFHALSTFLRVTIAENSPKFIFLHGGAIGWKGEGIVFPGDSFAGKTTLVAELVRLGAEYYSDDFALFDEQGRLHPFPRPLSIRSPDGRYARTAMPVDEIGGQAATSPVDVSTICFTYFDPKVKDQEPLILSAGEGVLELMKYTFSFIRRPQASLPVLQRLATNANILSGPRCEAADFAKTLLEFVDKRSV